MHQCERPDINSGGCALFASKIFGVIFCETLSRLKPRVLLVVLEQVSTFLRLRTLAPDEDPSLSWRGLKSNGKFMLSQLGCIEIVAIRRHWCVMLSESIGLAHCQIQFLILSLQSALTAAYSRTARTIRVSSQS